MAIQIQVDINDESVKALIQSLANLGREKFDGGLREIGETIRSITLDAFEAGRSPDGEIWKKSKRVEEEGGQTLVDDAILQNSIDVKSRDGKVEVGTDVVYAAIHQLGGKTGRGRKVRMPARPFLPTADSRVVRSTVLDVLSESIKTAVGRRL